MKRQRALVGVARISATLAGIAVFAIAGYPLGLYLPGDAFRFWFVLIGIAIALAFTIHKKRTDWVVITVVLCAAASYATITAGRLQFIDEHPLPASEAAP